MSGNISVSPNADGTYTGSVTLTLDGAEYSGTFILKPNTNTTKPDAPTLSVGAPQQASIPVSIAPANSGPALDHGNFRINCKAHSSTTWTNAHKIAYCTPGKGTITDTKANTWSLNAAGNPVVNTKADTVSHAAMLLLVDDVVWQVDTAGDWYSVTPTANATASLAWQGPTKTSPLSNLSVSGLTASTAYDLQGMVSNSGGNSNPATANATTASRTTTGGGTGPSATGNFVVVACDQPFNYPKGTGQQYVSQRMYGVGTGGAGDGNFGIFSDATFRQLMGQVNPGLWMFKNSGQAYWNSDLSINQAAIANLFNGFHETDPLGISGVMLSIDWAQVPGGNGNPQQYAKGVAALAKYLVGAKMSNGAPFPILGFIGQDEPDGQGEDTVASYYREFAPAVKAVSNDLLIGGPQTSYIQWTDFGTKGFPLDVFSANYFQGGDSRPVDDMSWVNNNQWAGIAQAAAGAGGNLKATMMGGYGLDWNCGSPADNSYVGALFAAAGYIDALNNAKLPFWPCKWDAQGDGTCGVITATRQAGQYYGVTNQQQITPKGYFYAEGVRNFHGPRLQVSKAPSQLKVVAVSPAVGRVSVMVVNTGPSAQNGTIAMSKWPVNSTGDATANVWQMDSTIKLPGTDGKRTTVQVSKGVTAPLSFPGPSVTIVSI